jgi:hypothetical protein
MRRAKLPAAGKAGRFACKKKNEFYSIYTQLPQQQTLAARGLEEHVQVSLIFAIIVSLTLFRRISYSRFTWIHDFEE